MSRPAALPDRQRGRVTALGLAFAVTLSSAGLGCGTSCEEIARHHEAFLGRAAHTDAPHATVTIPFGLTNRLLGERLAGRTSDRLEVPALSALGLHLGVSFALTGARLAPPERDDGAAARVAVEVDVAVRDGDLALFSLNLVVEVRPVVDAAARVVRVMLRPDGLRRVSPRLDPEGRARVAAWIRRALPPALAAALNDAAAAQLGELAVSWLGDTGFPLIRDHLLDGLEESPLVTLALPDLPLTAVSFVVSRGRTPALTVELVTGLPVTHGLAPTHASPPRDAVLVRLAGETAAELANRAIVAGALPARYDGDGQADPDGPYEARLGWSEGLRPLKVHLWRERGRCTYARLGGTPGASFVGDRLRIAVTDGTFEVVRGPALTEAFAWTERLWGDSVKLAAEVAHSTRVELAGTALALRIAGVEADPREVRVRLEVSSAADTTAPGGRVGARARPRSAATQHSQNR